MGADPLPDQLHEIRYVALLVRLAIANDGRLLHGEFVDLEGQPCGHFRDWNQMLRVLQSSAAAADAPPLGEEPPSS